MYQFSSKHTGEGVPMQDCSGHNKLLDALTRTALLPRPQQAALCDWVSKVIAGNIEAVAIHSHGWSNVVLEITLANSGPNWMLRLPRSGSSSHTQQCRFELEALIIGKLRQTSLRLGDKVDDTCCESLFANIELAPTVLASAMLYPKLSGRPFDWQTLSAIEDAPLARTLATVLATIHRLEHASVTVEHYPHGDEAFLDEVLPIALKYIDTQARRQALSYFSKAQPRFGDAGQSSGQAVLCHGDFGPANILIKEDRRLGAIIDFSDLCLNDAAMDLAPLWRRTPAAFFSQLLSHYQQALGQDRWQAIDPQTLMQRIQFHALRRAAFVLWYADRHGFTEGLEPSIQYLANSFANPIVICHSHKTQA